MSPIVKGAEAAAAWEGGGGRGDGAGGGAYGLFTSCKASLSRFSREDDARSRPSAAGAFFIKQRSTNENISRVLPFITG